MGIIIDIILVAILLLSTFLGYKKGLVKLGTKLFAGIIAIIVTIVIYKPVANMIINNTQIDNKIENAIIENTSNLINEDSQITENITNQILPEQAKNISKSIVYAMTAIVLFIFVKIALSIVISLADFVANLPILKQFNEVGGIIYGIIRGVLIICICIIFIGIFIKINPDSLLNNQIQSSYLTKAIYENIVKF